MNSALPIGTRCIDSKMKAANISLAVVIPCFNRRDVTLACIRRLNGGSLPVTLFVCDSASSDGTAESVVHEPNVRLLQADTDAWWSAAINLGIRAALRDQFDAIVLMNDDISFDDDLMLRLLEKHRQHPDAIISPLQTAPAGNFLGSKYVGPYKKTEILSGALTDSVVDTTNGCCLLVPRIIFESVGLIDELHCPHLYGDTEFQLRAKKAGFNTVACPSIHIAQHEASNYFSRLKFFSLLSFNGSPLHLSSYLYFGKTLFGSWVNFAVLGFFFHISFMKVAIKVIFLISRRFVSFHH